MKHWGAAQVLWTLQGDLAIDQLSGDLPNTIRSILGAQVAGPEGSRLERRIHDLFDQYFTSNGKLKKGQNAPEVVRLEERLAAIRKDLGQARLRFDTYEASRERLVDLRAAQAQARRDADAIRQTLEAADKRAQAYAALTAEDGEQTARVKAAEAHWRELQQRIEQIVATARDLARAGAERRTTARLGHIAAGSGGPCRGSGPV